MFIKNYTDVLIQGTQFTIVEKTWNFWDKRDWKNWWNGWELTALKNIERVVHDNLNYLNEANDEYAKLPHEQLLGKLRKKARIIQEGYTEKTSQFSCVRKFFCRTADEERKIKEVEERINPLVSRFSVLPEDIVQEIFSLLNVEDMQRLAQTIEKGDDHLKKARLRRAKEYGYMGNDSLEAKSYIETLFRGINTLVQDGHISGVYHESVPLQLDVEKTFRNVKNLAGEEKVLDKVNKAAIEYAKKGDAEALGALITLGVSTETKGFDGNDPCPYTLLELAVIHDHEAAVKLLIAKRADLNAQGKKDHKLPLKLAVSTSSISMIRLLLENGAQITTELFDALRRYVPGENSVGGYIIWNIVDLLLEYGADINSPCVGYHKFPGHVEPFNYTPLAAADFSMMAFLISKGADGDGEDACGNTPLIKLVDWGISVDCLKMILERKAADNIDHINEKGFNALHIAAKRNQLETVKILLDYKANRDVLTSDGRTAFELTDHWHIQKLLQPNEKGIHP